MNQDLKELAIVLQHASERIEHLLSKQMLDVDSEMYLEKVCFSLVQDADTIMNMQREVAYA